MKVNNLINAFFDELKAEGVWLDNLTDSSLQLVKKVMNRKPCIIWINDHLQLKPIYVNDFGREYYGFSKNDMSDEGYEFYNTFMNPEDFAGEEVISFFDNFSNEVHRMPYRVKNSSGDWKWTYSLSRALNHNKIGRAIYVLSVVWDIDKMIESNLKTELLSDAGAPIDSEMVLYNSLTKREKQILNLIGKDMTSNEIADQLYIESSTVDTHRKHIIKKLQAKSSLGLVRYALLYSENAL